MRIEDQVYFAPGIRFADVDFHGAGLPQQLRARMWGFYLKPAYRCAGIGDAFATGVLVLSCVDALARLQTGDGVVGRRFMEFARVNLPSFTVGDLADRLYYDFRNGLIHEGRIKRAAQFSLDFGSTVATADGIMIINPARLADEVSRALDSYIGVLEADCNARRRLSDTLSRDCAPDLAETGRL